MITPRPALVITGAICLAPSIVPITLIDSTRSASSTFNSSIAVKWTTAALLMRMSTAPNASVAVATIAAQSASERTSSFEKRAAAPISAASAWPLSSTTSPITTFAPSAANRRAVAAPMPCEPPVTIAALPFNRPKNSLLEIAWRY